MKILLVDHDECALLLLKECIEAVFTAERFEIEIFTDPMLAIQYMTRHKEGEIYFIFVALLMNCIDGFHFMRLSRQILPGVPVFALGHTDSWEMKRLSYMNGAVDYIIKPVTVAGIHGATANL